MSKTHQKGRRSFAELRLQRRLHRGTRGGVPSAGMVLQRQGDPMVDLFGFGAPASQLRHGVSRHKRMMVFFFCFLLK